MKHIKILAVLVLTAVAIIMPLEQSHAQFGNLFDSEKSSKPKSKSSCPVKIGMTMNQVRDKLGDPDSENEATDGSVMWVYSADSVAARLQDGAVDEGIGAAVGSLGLPFGGCTLSSAGDRATKPIKAKRMGYYIYFKGDKVSGIERSKRQG